ncbi:MAG: hypothetical protein IT201_12195 [Thermoleophilia bacterium]|nr:hypothetical protein [Thermoleophilia bacterium]
MFSPPEIARRVAPSIPPWRSGLAVAAVALAVSCGGERAGTAAAAAALRDRLEALDLSVRSIDCIDSELELEGRAAYRCTVNFGDPHLVPYCVALLEGGPVTDRERPELRCYPPEEEQRYRENARLEP